jgi:inosine-uridine nucleoside N-ribohydrolase
MTFIAYDCDPGNDDAVAILAALGHPSLRVTSITTGAGHLSADRTARNAAIAVAAARPASAPVCIGSEGPLLRERLIARFLDMERGLDRERPDLEAVPLDPLHSVDRIASDVRRHPGLTLVATGPLTNIAMGMRRFPEIIRRIGRIITLSGAWGLGTRTAAAEWNILCDPEAAAIVLTSGVPITMIPVDASGQVPITAELTVNLEKLGTTAALFAKDLLRSLMTTHRRSLFGPALPPLHDPCAILLAAEPGLGRTEKARVDVDTRPGLNYGRTVIDFSGGSDLPANCDVVVAFDLQAIHAELLRAIAVLGARVDA